MRETLRYIYDTDDVDERCPVLENYGLTSKDLEKYQKAQDCYNRAIKMEQAENRQKVRVLIGVMLPCAIILHFIAMILLAMEDFIGIGITFFCLGVLLLVIMAIAATKISSSSTIVERFYINPELKERVNKYNKAKEIYLDCVEKSRRNYWINMSGYRFETEVAWLYRQLGYTAVVTPKSGDGGVDIILTNGEQKIAVQCKHHSSEVGPHDVRALKGVVADQDFSSGIFVSLNGFTSTVYQENRNGKIEIELVTLSDILDMVDECSKNNALQSICSLKKNVPEFQKDNIKDLFLENQNIRRRERGNIVSHQQRGKLTNSNRVVEVGSKVKICNLGMDEIEEYKIVESNMNNKDGYISKTSKLGEALLGRKDGDIIEVKTDQEKYSVEILEIE